MNDRFPKLLEDVLEWVLTNQAKKVMLVWHKDTQLWRDPNDFILLDHEARAADAGQYPNQTYFYDKELDPHDSIRSYLVTEGWDWALNVDWATSLDFAQKFRPLYAVEGTIFGAGEDTIKWIKRGLHIKEVIRGFTLEPTMATSHAEPEPHYIVMSETDAVVLRFAIDDSKG